ncbi:hypothetical protein C4J81_02995 [Deltaproteobacteria bacterium Smac51]|nr:hypothetical protein C4J81_02995 [Deltaproteobacteria bacterium Smac51]
MNNRKAADMPLKPAPQGMILMVTLIVMLIMGVMGAAIITNTQTELQISGNTNLGREAFTRADAGMNVATSLVDILVASRGAGSVCDILSNDTISNTFYLDTTCPQLLAIQDRLDAADPYSIGRRYGLAGSDTSGINDENIIRIGGRTHTPDGKVERDETVATVVITRDFGAGLETDGSSGGYTNGWASGASLTGSTGHGGPVGSAVPRVYVLSVNGRHPGANSGNLFGAEVNENLSGPHTVITVLYRTTISE